MKAFARLLASHSDFSNATKEPDSSTGPAPALEAFPFPVAPGRGRAAASWDLAVVRLGARPRIDLRANLRPCRFALRIGAQHGAYWPAGETVVA